MKYSALLSGILAILMMAAIGCNDDGSDPVPTDGDVDEIVAKTTEEVTLVPVKPAMHPPEETCEGRDAPAWCENPALYANGGESIKAAKDNGFGEVQEGPGLDAVDYEDLGTARPNAGEGQKVLSFAHTSDVHICDMESVTRTAMMDVPSLDSALRPQDPYSCQVFDAAIRTLNAYNKQHGLDFLMISGDTTDSAQINEVDWLTTILHGGEVHCDSGVDNDHIPGPGNDPQDPFEAAGLDIPWYFAFGNHDELVMGNAEITADAKIEVIGDYAVLGTRDGETWEVTTEGVADPAREYLFHEEFIAEILNAPGEPDGHGFTQENLDQNKGYYAFDAPNGAPVRFIVVDTTFRSYGFEGQFSYVNGVLSKDQIDDFIIPELDAAMENHMFVILSGHHPIDSMQDDGKPDKYYGGQEFAALLHEYPNVIAYLGGHHHENHVYTVAHESPDKSTPENGYWEIQVSSLADYPMQTRLYELREWGEGVYSMKTVVMDFVAQPGDLAWEARTVSLIDVQTGWCPDENPGPEDERNVEMFFQAPAQWDN